MRWMRATLRVVAGLLEILLVACAARPERHGVPALTSTADLRVIERGRYLVRGPAHCAACHGDTARAAEDRAGDDVPLAGGRRFDLGIAGTLVARNLTSDVDAGIGAWTDAELVRVLRYGRTRAGRPLVPLMEFQGLSDTDLQAVLSYLRTLPPDPRPAPPSAPSLIGRLALRTVIRSQETTEVPPAEVPNGRDVEYGRYLADTVANCDGCHTRRSALTGRYVGPAYGGGMELKEDAGVFRPPDITIAGVLGRLSAEAFVAEFRSRAESTAGSPMPWSAYANMTDEDLRSIYRYLRTLPPAVMSGTPVKDKPPAADG